MGLRITAAGPGTTIQDGGRAGLLRFGVTTAGAMDWAAMRSANLGLGNPPDAAAVEIAGGGLTLVCADASVTLAFCGGGFTWTRDGERLPGAARVQLAPGSVLSARAGAWGTFAYLAVPGGVDVPLVMGSRATHTRSGVGTRMLEAGDVLTLGQSSQGQRPGQGQHGDDVIFDAPWLARTTDPLRVVLGPQDDCFTPAGIDTFLSETFTLTPAADRMAYKLTGPRIAHKGDFNIVTDGVALGAVQIAGDGQPIVLMADRQPTGGYPKIGHVCRADIGRLAQCRPGDPVTFRAVDPETARATLLALEDHLDTIRDYTAPLRRVPTTESLTAVNLISGVADGRMDRAD